MYKTKKRLRVSKFGLSLSSDFRHHRSMLGRISGLDFGPEILLLSNSFIVCIGTPANSQFAYLCRVVWPSICSRQGGVIKVQACGVGSEACKIACDYKLLSLIAVPPHPDISDGFQTSRIYELFVRLRFHSRASSGRDGEHCVLEQMLRHLGKLPFSKFDVHLWAPSPRQRLYRTCQTKAIELRG